MGLSKQLPGQTVVRIKIFKCDEDSKSNYEEATSKLPIIEANVTMDSNADNEDAEATYNLTFDITHRKDEIFSQNSIFLIVSDHQISWTRISIVAYSNEESEKI